MKRLICVSLTVLLMFCLFSGTLNVYASSKSNETRAIAIVFDNSGSMYVNGEQAWCRATYAMEVFASMLNKGDQLLIYPMHPITVEGKEYSMDSPFKITDSSKAATIRDIYTPNAGGTPIESIDKAASGLKNLSADHKYMIVLTDGNAFYRNGWEMSATETKKQLDTRFDSYSGTDMTVMYLGIGSNVVMPDKAATDNFVKKQAKSSDIVLSTLTEMCNLIFGRDTLPQNRINGKKVDFDISISKLIVFVQGENVSNLKIDGLGTPVTKATTKYASNGCGNYKSVSDTTLQGMMVTYTDCPAGTYNIEYSGTATSIEVYYEPDADLDFVFTDSNGNAVDPNALYEGEYKVSFGMKDAKTGKLISSNLLGNPHYEGTYSINGVKYPISCEGYNGETPVTLSMNDSFDANLTVTYLSGYSITKNSLDFGWPFGGIKVAPRPAGNLRLEISGGDSEYFLQELEGSTPFIAKVYYQGSQLTGGDLEKVELKWDPDTSNVEIKKEFADDHWKLSLHHKNPDVPENTTCGECVVPIYAFYSAKGSAESDAQSTVRYNIKAARPAGDLVLEISGGESVYSLQDLTEGTPYVAKIYYQGELLTGRELERVDLRWDPDTSNVEIKKEFADDHWKLSLHYKDPLSPQDTVCGECTVTIFAYYTKDGYSEAEAECNMTYNLEDDFSPLGIELSVTESYIVINELGDNEIIVNLTLNGEKLNSRDFSAVVLDVDCDGINYTLVENEQDSSYVIKFLPAEGIDEGAYTIKVTGQYTDHIGRVTETDASHSLTLSNIPLWLKWCIYLLILLIIIIIILLILHIKVLPSKAHVTKKDSSFIFDGEDETKSTTFDCNIKKGQMNMHCKYAGTKTGLVMDVKPGKDSYLKKTQARRSAEVKSGSVRKFGNATIMEASIGSIRYTLNEDTGKLERTPKNDKPFNLKHGMQITYSGTMLNAGMAKPFTVNTKLNFKKK